LNAKSIYEIVSADFQAKTFTLLQGTSETRDVF
jgi:hypothetical protein